MRTIYTFKQQKKTKKEKKWGEFKLINGSKANRVVENCGDTLVPKEQESQKVLFKSKSWANGFDELNCWQTKS